MHNFLLLSFYSSSAEFLAKKIIYASKKKGNRRNFCVKATEAQWLTYIYARINTFQLVITHLNGKFIYIFVSE